MTGTYNGHDFDPVFVGYSLHTPNGTVPANQVSVTVPGHWETVTTNKTVTTTDHTRFDNGVIDVSMIPYMRQQLISFSGSHFRPNRRVYFFFDGVDVTDHIVRHDEITLTQNSSNGIYQTGYANGDQMVVSTGNTHHIVQHRRHFGYDDPNSANHPTLLSLASGSLRRKLSVAGNTVGEYPIGTVFTGSKSGNTGTILSANVRGGISLGAFFASTSANTIQLPKRAKVIANNYWGTDSSNAITLMSKSNRNARPFRSWITGYNNVTQTLTLSNTHAVISTVYANSDIPSPVSTANDVTWTIHSGITNAHYTDEEGKISGVFAVPPGMFRTGERVFMIIDAADGVPADATTRGEYRFNSYGLKETKNDIVLNTTSTSTVPSTEQRWVPPTTTGGHSDPIAQTFFINEFEHPSGVFISSVGLYFYNKDLILPVTVQIVPTYNGYPDTHRIIPDAEKTLDAEFVHTSADASIETKITFNSPIFLPSGEYAILIKSSSLEYEVFVAELGSKIIGTDRIVSSQPYIGSFFKSQNSSTWDAIQLEDLAFNLYKCQFGTSGTVDFVNDVPSNDMPADTLYVHINDNELSNTTVTYTHSYDSGSTFFSYDPDSNFTPNGGRVTITASASNYKLRAALTTGDTDVSPIIYNKTGNLLAIENYIDNANLDPEDFTIVTPGYYSANVNGTVTLNVVDYRGSGYATVTANVNSSGNVANIKVIDGGTGFINNSTVRVSVDSAATSNAVITISSELDPHGGPAVAKYISRVVSLAEGFEAGDIRLMITAYKPQGTDIKAYLKIRNYNDPEQFESKGYQLLNQTTKSTLYSPLQNFNQPIEYSFETADPINATSYSTSTTTYTSFSQFAIKLVLLSDDTTSYPIVYDMRAIALPAMSS